MKRGQCVECDEWRLLCSCGCCDDCCDCLEGVERDDGDDEIESEENLSDR